MGSPRVIPARGASSGSAAFRRRRAGPKTVRRRNRSPSWASAMTYRPRFLPELWLCRAAPLARSRRRRARPCVELLHNLRAGQPRADHPQPGGPAGVHDADRLSARPAGLCRGSHHPTASQKGAGIVLRDQRRPGPLSVRTPVAARMAPSARNFPRVICAVTEYPNGLALAPDERTMYVATPARPYLAAAFESF